MYARTEHDALTFAMYPAATAQPTSATTQLDNHHRATLARPSSHRLRRALGAAVTVLREPTV